jgi:hypothetical protein
MAAYTRFTTFEDAFYFYVQAKSLPVVASSEAERSRYVRVSILLSWVALEEALKGALTIWQTRGRITGSVPKKLYERLCS